MVFDVWPWIYIPFLAAAITFLFHIWSFVNIEFFSSGVICGFILVNCHRCTSSSMKCADVYLPTSLILWRELCIVSKQQTGHKFSYFLHFIVARPLVKSLYFTLFFQNICLKGVNFIDSLERRDPEAMWNLLQILRS